MMGAGGPDGRMDSRAEEEMRGFDEDGSGGRRQTDSDVRDRG